MIQSNIDIHVTAVTGLQITLEYDRVPTIKMPEKEKKLLLISRQV